MRPASLGRPAGLVRPPVWWHPARPGRPARPARVGHLG